MTYEECMTLVDAFEQATLLKQRLAFSDEERATAGAIADSLGEFIASMMAMGWRMAERRGDE